MCWASSCRWCVLNCGVKGEAHHVLFRAHGGDDDAANLVCVCLVHHSLVHANDISTLVLLGEHLLLERPDTLDYIKGKLGDAEGAAWLARRLHVQP